MLEVLVDVPSDLGLHRDEVQRGVRRQRWIVREQARLGELGNVLELAGQATVRHRVNRVRPAYAPSTSGTAPSPVPITASRPIRPARNHRAARGDGVHSRDGRGSSVVSAHGARLGAETAGTGGDTSPPAGGVVTVGGGASPGAGSPVAVSGEEPPACAHAVVAPAAWMIATNPRNRMTPSGRERITPSFQTRRTR
jgi:hypothetical protein